MIIDKEILGAASLLLSISQFIPYCRAIMAGRIRPHVFSRFIWGLTAAIVCVAQFADHGGPGAWSAGLSAFGCFIAVGLSLRHHGDKHIKPFDWVCLVFALAAIPLWYVTKDPLGSVILVTVIDGAGYLPSFRKCWNRPQDDMVYAYALGLLKHCLSLSALEHYSVTTMLYSIFCIVADAGFIALILGCRWALRKPV